MGLIFLFWVRSLQLGVLVLPDLGSYLGDPIVRWSGIDLVVSVETSSPDDLHLNSHAMSGMGSCALGQAARLHPIESQPMGLRVAGSTGA